MTYEAGLPATRGAQGLTVDSGASRSAPTTPGDLEAMLDEQALVVHYQPVVDLRTGGVVAAEALSRLDVGAPELLQPADFIPLAIDSGLIHRIDAQVLAIAAAQAKLWRAGSEGSTFRVAVNVTFPDLGAGYAERVSDVAAHAGVPREALIVEVVELSLPPDLPQHQAVLETLTAEGVAVFLDDFGTGFSSLTHLQRLSVSGIKIDRSFVSELPEEGRGMAITQALIDLGETLGIEVVAEGIETPRQAQLLQDMGCPYGQGFLFGRPVSADPGLAHVEQQGTSASRVAWPDAQTCSSGP